MFEGILSQQGHLINNKCLFLSQDTLFETEMVNCCVYLSDAEVGEVSGLLLKAALSVVVSFCSCRFWGSQSPYLLSTTPRKRAAEITRQQRTSRQGRLLLEISVLIG